MPASSISFPSDSNKIESYLSPDNHVNKIHNFPDEISLIKNDSINMEKINQSPSKLRSILNFFSCIKNKLSVNRLPPPPVDIELENILSQGRILSHDLNVTSPLPDHTLNNTTTPISLLTTKTGAILGSILIAGAMVRGGFYYFQRTCRENNITPYNTTNNPISTTIPFNTDRPFQYYVTDENKVLSSQSTKYNQSQNKTNYFNPPLKKTALKQSKKIKKRGHYPDINAIPSPLSGQSGPLSKVISQLKYVTFSTVNPSPATNISDNNKENQYIKKVSTLECYTERENLTEAKILRIISDTLNKPFSNVIKEGQVVIQYDYLDQGCVNNTLFQDISKKVESAIDSLLSWIPSYNQMRFIVRVVASILEGYSDSLEKKQSSFDNIDDLHSRIIGISKDITSSISTKDINRLSHPFRIRENDGIREGDETLETKDIVNALDYGNNEIIATIGDDKNKLKITRNFNHLYSLEKRGFLFYDNTGKWAIYNSVELNDHIKETYSKAVSLWNNPQHTYLIKNSSPEFYGNGMIVLYDGYIYSLINNNLHKIKEIQLNDNVFRYLAEDENTLSPIIFKENNWHFEEKTSPAASQELQLLLAHVSKIKNNLLSKNIDHQDVSPLIQDHPIQYDKNSNKYIKIDNQYYIIKQSLDTMNYIEGSHDILPLEKRSGQYYIKENALDDICCLYREPIESINGINQDNSYFLDNTVINYIKNIPNDQISINIKDTPKHEITISKDIEGAIEHNGANYIPYD